MFLRFKNFIKCSVILLSLFTSATAFAEAGDGWDVGDYTLQPGVVLGVRYLTNLFNVPTEVETHGAPLLYVTPFFNVDSAKDAPVRLRLNSKVTWNQLFGEKPIPDQSGLSADIHFLGSFNETGDFSVTLKNDFVRNLLPPLFSDQPQHITMQNDVGVELGVHPGGQAFRLVAGYHFVRLWSKPIEEFKQTRHQALLRGEWYFLPSTAVLFDGSFEYLKYDTAKSEGTAKSSGRPLYLHNNSTPLRLLLGIHGLITDTIALRLFVGYGNSFHKKDTFNSVIGNVEFYWRFGDFDKSNAFRLGYEHNFEESVVGTYHKFHRIYTSFHQSFFDRKLVIDALFGVSLRYYYGMPDTIPNASKSWRDTYFTFSAGVTYNIFKWWGLNLSYKVDATTAENEIRTIDIGMPGLRKFNSHVITLNTEFKY